jgi:outer membrane lipoprotein-sorting protein
VTPAWGSETAAAEIRDAVTRVEASMAGVRTVSARFEQERQLSVLKRTLVIRGTATIERPRRIAWQVDEPVRYCLVVNGEEIRQWDEDTDRVQTLSLDRTPALKAAFQQMTVWFSGHYSNLLQDYGVTLEQARPCILTFAPKPQTPLASMLKSVTVTFREDERYIEQLAIREAGGDQTVIRFQDTRLNEPIPEDAWRLPPRQRSP